MIHEHTFNVYRSPQPCPQWPLMRLRAQLPHSPQAAQRLHTQPPKPRLKPIRHQLRTLRTCEPKKGFLGESVVKNLLANSGDTGLIPGLGRSTGGGKGNPLQDSCWDYLMDRRAWQAAVLGVIMSQTWLKHTRAKEEGQWEIYSGKWGGGWGTDKISSFLGQEREGLVPFISSGSPISRC